MLLGRPGDDNRDGNGGELPRRWRTSAHESCARSKQANCGEQW